MDEKNNTALISVILPVYNAQHYLEACLEALVKQKMRDIEIIAVNDGSIDKSLDILQKYARKDSRIYVYTQSNKGVSSARNLALDKAKGKYLAFCDSDNTVPPDAYLKLANCAEKYQADVVSGAYYNVVENGERQIEYSHKRESKFRQFYSVPCVWNKLILRELVEENKLRFEDLAVGEDVVFLAEIFVRMKNFRTIPNGVYEHWHRLSEIPSLNHRYNEKYFGDHIKCRNRLLEICGELDGNEAEEYVYYDLTPFLLDFLLRIFDGAEREKAFEQLKGFLNQHNWQGKELWFEDVCGVSPEELQKLTARQYFANTLFYDAKEVVLNKTKTGQIGMIYILRYIKAWVNFKVGKMIRG